MVEEKKPTLNDLVGKDLSKFNVVEMIHVYRTDYDGRFANSLGFFRDPNVAMAFAGMQDGGTSYTKTASTLILTDGTVGYQLTQQESVKFFDDEKEALDLRQKALAKLSPAERALLGFMD